MPLLKKDLWTMILGNNNDEQSGGTPPVASHILTEGGDILATESGNELITET